MAPPIFHNSSKPAVVFWGAAKTVTGSLHLVQAAGVNLFLDCGLSRAHVPSAPDVEPPFPVPAAEVAAVVLSHAHIDHCGHLPLLVRQGFTGPIYCTPATRDLIALMLAGSARFQEQEQFVRGILEEGAPEQPAGESPRAVVRQVLAQCIALPYDQVHEICPGVRLRLLDAGHILGSAMAHLNFDGRSLLFTGDLGRRRPLLLNPPVALAPADLVISESTYGGRVLGPAAEAATALEEIVRRTADRQGKVLIPTFSLGRAQVVVHVLVQALRGGRIPELPIFVDSLMAADITDVYRRYRTTEPALAIDSLDSPLVSYLRSAEESKKASARREPCVILAPGGMCEGGRILYHLKQHIDDPRCSVVLVNYQAPHTPGRRLLERGPRVRFHGRSWNKWADVIYLTGFSGHADHDDLLALLGPLAATSCRVRLVHGDREQTEALAAALRLRGFPDVAIPSRGQRLEI